MLTVFPPALGGLHPMRRGSAWLRALPFRGSSDVVHFRYGSSVPFPQLPTPPRGGAVEFMFRREQSNSTGGTFTQVEVSFAGADRMSGGVGGGRGNPPADPIDRASFVLARERARLLNELREMVRLVVASLFVCFAFCHACAQPAADLLAGGFRLKGGVFALYSGTEAEPATVVRLDRLYTDYESKGFFRIGVLPLGVMDGVTFELRHPESVTKSLAQLHQWLEPRAARRLELRRVSFVVSAPVTNRLETGRARLAAGGRLALFDGVFLVSGTNELRAARCVLQISGAQAGRLIIETTPPWTNSLFGRLETLNPSN